MLSKFAPAILPAINHKNPSGRKMKAGERYKKVFGEIKSLNDEVPWPSGLSNMMEHFLWETSNVLGISKTEFAKHIMDLCLSDDFMKLDKLDKDSCWGFVEKELKILRESSDTADRRVKPKYGYLSPTEALKKARFFSEDYLNKQFDIFMALCSDDYLDNLYRTIDLKIHGGEQWFTHGNSGLFSESVGFSSLRMQMDNLAYNQKENILIANELKLGGKKNEDQILKYAHMWGVLEDKDFIKKGCDLALLFISDIVEKKMDLNAEIDSEVNYCSTSKKDLRYLADIKNIQRAKNIKLRQMTWHDIIKFNEEYAEKLKSEKQDKQVEQKLLRGFNKALGEKDFMQTSKA